MRALRRSIKGDKGENRPQHVSISPKSDFAINAPIKVIIAKESFNPNTTTRSPFTTMSAEQISKFVAFEKDEYFHVTRLPNQGENYYEAWTNDHGNYRRGLVPIDKFDEVAKQRRSAGSSAMGTPSLPDSGYSTARSHGRSESGMMTPSTPRHARQSSITRGAMVYGVVQYDFNAERPDELEAKAGEAIIVIAQSNPEWFVAKPIGRLGGPGLIPVSFIEIKDMATGLPVPDPHKAVQAAGVPKVEEWKKLAAEYKNSSITLGQLSMPGGGQAGANGLSQGMQQMAISPGGQQGSGGQTPQSAQYSQQQQMPPPPQPQSTQRRLLAPVSASIPRYCFENDKYWYIIECVMEDGSHWELSRFYQNFYDFQIKLLQQFPAEAATQGGTRILPFMPGPVTYVTDAISNGRRESLDDYVKRLIELPHYISRCQLVRELFAPREGDFELDPKAMQEDYRLSSTSQNSDMQNSQTLSREPSNHPYDSNPYSTQARSNPWGGNQHDSGYPGYSTNSSQSNQNLHESNYGNPNGSNSGFHGGSSAQDVSVKVWFEDDCMALKAAADTTFDELEGRVKERLKKGPLKHLDPKKYFSIDIHYKSNSGTQPLNDDNDLRRAISTVEGTDHSLQLYVSSYD